MRKSPTTFGPVGRILITLAVFAPPVWMVWAAQSLWGLTFCTGWLIIGVPLLMRGVWSRGRVS